MDPKELAEESNKLMYKKKNMKKKNLKDRNDQRKECKLKKMEENLESVRETILMTMAMKVMEMNSTLKLKELTNKMDLMI